MLFLWNFHLFGLKKSIPPHMLQACPKHVPSMPRLLFRKYSPRDISKSHACREPLSDLGHDGGRSHGLGRRICRWSEFDVWFHLHRGDWLGTMGMIPIYVTGVCMSVYICVYIYILYIYIQHMCVCVCTYAHYAHLHYPPANEQFDMENPWFPRQNYLQVGCPFCQYLCQFTGG